MKTGKGLVLITASLSRSDILVNHLRDILLALRIAFFFGLALFLLSLVRKTQHLSSSFLLSDYLSPFMGLFG